MKFPPNINATSGESDNQAFSFDADEFDADEIERCLQSVVHEKA